MQLPIQFNLRNYNTEYRGNTISCVIMFPMNTKDFFEKNTNLCFLLLVLIGSGLFISLIFNNNLWVDEAFTASIIRCPLPEVWTRTASDTLPPFYNFFGKLMTTLFGYSAPVMKFTSVLPMTGALLLSAFPVRRLFGAKTSLIFTLFLLSMPNFYYYAVEIRMYSWGIFAVLGAAIYAASALKSGSRRDWGLLSFFTVLSGYVHHFAFVSSGMLWLFSLILLLFPALTGNDPAKSADLKKRLIPWCLSLLVTFILYFPCMLLTVYQIKNASSYFSMTPLTVHSFLSDLRFPFVTHFTILSALLMLSAIASIAVSLLIFLTKKKTASPLVLIGILFTAVFFSTLIFGYAVSIAAGSSLFTARYLVPALGVFWLGCSILIDLCIRNTAGNNMITKLLYAWIFALALITGIVTYRSQFISEYADGVDQMTAFFDSALKPDDGYVIYENSYQIENCFRYYYPDLKKYEWDNADEIKGNIWFFAVDGFKKELEQAHDYGYNIQYIEHMTFDRYEFDLYRATPIHSNE